MQLVTRRCILSCVVAIAFSMLGHPFALHAQGGSSAIPGGVTRPGVVVRGLAYDSLRRAPLAGAFVSVEGQSRSTVSDADGKFVFERLPPGRYQFAMQHAALDSIGLSGVTARVNVTDGSELVTLAVPSFPRLWRTMCGSRAVPMDSGFVYGTVRDARTGQPLAGASIDISWVHLSKVDREGSTQINQRRWRNIGRSDSAGDFSVCGVPIDEMVRIRGVGDSSATDLIDLPITTSRVRRRDLLLATAADSGAHGAIAGFLSAPDGRPLYGVRVSVEGVPEARSANDGRFILRGVPSGTRQVEFLAIGMMPVSSVVDVRANDTVRVAATLRNVTTLDVVKVTGTTIQKRRLLAMEERRRIGLGYQVDSTRIGRSATLASVFASMPGVRVARSRAGSRFSILLSNPAAGRAECPAFLILDGVPRTGQDELDLLRASDIASIEVFQRAYSVPADLMPSRSVNCGVVLVWTKEAFR